MGIMYHGYHGHSLHYIYRLTNTMIIVTEYLSCMNTASTCSYSTKDRYHDYMQLQY